MPEFSTGSDAMTVKEYLDAHHVSCTPCHPDTAYPVSVSIPQLPDWVPAPPDTAPDAHTILVNPTHTAQNWCPNAVLLHGKLSPAIDAEQLLACAFTDSRRLPDWREYEWNRFRYQGHPSAFIRGVYTVGQWTLSATTRYIAITNGPDQYLTQLTVTTLLDQADELDIDVTVMNVGLTIALH
ncbi:LpqN/LpqT family lipoprotein [Rhodococcus marinonascens]|uniref:LpqN/LpqT family lipoprotein n=1 Tax=Rhodococcus marinonascens TaxID=38311 RepID=UPI0009FD9EEE|nr:LpqN/LpqT family lipoprotein [Rhodococcus marinonascens]